MSGASSMSVRCKSMMILHNPSVDHYPAVRTNNKSSMQSLDEALPTYHDDATIIGRSLNWDFLTHRTRATTGPDVGRLGGEILRNRTIVRPRAAKATICHAVHGEEVRVQGDVRLKSLIFLNSKGSVSMRLD